MGERGRLTRAGRAFLADPVEVLLTAHAKVAERKELRAMRTKGVGGFMPWPPCPYDVDDDWERSLHELVGAPWPCPAIDDFWQLWPKVTQPIEAKGFRLGRGAFGKWGDGEPGMVRAIWCLVHHLRPSVVVETGVARGITTRFILEAFARNESGRLWSIDLPPPLHRDLHAHIAAAVPERLRDRWTLVYGSSRRRLRRLLAQLDEIDMFVHDSRHSERNLLFELDHAWRALKPGGVLVADDVDLNCGFHSFGATHAEHDSVLCHAEPLEPDFGRQEDRGVFGVVREGSTSRTSRGSPRTQTIA
jgi:Methyltransferase domain